MILKDLNQKQKNGEKSQFQICTELPELKDRDLYD